MWAGAGNCVYETRVRSRGDIGRVTAVVVYGGFDICVYMYIHMYVSVYMWGVGGDCSYMRLEYEVEGTSAA